MYSFTPKMNNETNVPTQGKYHSDAIYVMYALFIIMALGFCIVLTIIIINYCNNHLCNDCTICKNPCFCCYKKKYAKDNIYIVKTEAIPNDLNNEYIFYQDSRENNFNHYNNITTI